MQVQHANECQACRFFPILWYIGAFIPLCARRIDPRLASELADRIQKKTMHKLAAVLSMFAANSLPGAQH